MKLSPAERLMFPAPHLWIPKMNMLGVNNGHLIRHNGKLARCGGNEYTLCMEVPEELTATISLNWSDSVCGDCDQITGGDFVLLNRYTNPAYVCPSLPFPQHRCVWYYTDDRTCTESINGTFYVAFYITPYGGDGNTIGFPASLVLYASYRRCDSYTRESWNKWSASVASASDLADGLNAGLTLIYDSAGYSGIGSDPCSVSSTSNALIKV